MLDGDVMNPVIPSWMDPSTSAIAGAMALLRHSIATGYGTVNTSVRAAANGSADCHLTSMMCVRRS